MQYRPLVLEDRIRQRNGTPLIRAAVANALAFISHNHAERIVKQRWMHNRDTDCLVKAAVSQTTMAAADGLAITAVPDFFSAM